MTAIAAVLFVFCAAHYQKTSPKRPEDCGKIPAAEITGARRAILMGALAYVESRPKYKSKYYGAGYPDDGYGVCTDVVASAMKYAGVDLMEEVQNDIALHPDDYGIEKPDPSIDFRRVRNLSIYFAHTAKALTLDVSQTGQWQGGDIVIFQNHIGIVSDRRNENGVCYVIHHNSPWQRYYEEDILETREDIVGHYAL